MRKALFSLLLVALCATASFAQQDERGRTELFVGYSNLQAESGFDEDLTDEDDFNDFFDERTTLHGVNVAVTGYVTPRVGLTGDFAYHTASENFAGGTGSTAELRLRNFSFMGGPQVKFTTESRVEPFVRALFGVANSRARVRLNNVNTGDTTLFTGEVTDSSTNFSMALGGGLDVRVNERFAVRALQFDYNPIFFREREVDFLGVRDRLEGDRSDNYRFSFGVVFR